MIISPKRRRKASTLSRLLNWNGPSNTEAAQNQVVSEDEFRFELQKERSRIDRRVADSRFSLVLVSGVDLKQLANKPEVILALRERLRITDTIGWSSKRLTILLPETGREGAEIVAAQFESIAEFYEFNISCEICVYPDDYQVAHNSSEYKRSKDFQSSDSDEFSPDTLAAIGKEETDLIGGTFSCETERTPVWKRAIDILGASTGLIMLSPVLAGAAIAVKMSGPGPIFFRQKREGRNGKSFNILKFRTMCVDAESMKKRLREFSEQDGPAFKLENDPRLTQIGKYLRKSCIDELPQLLNVLTGDMSLVGPRPLPVDESFECQIWQRKRLEVTPGLTCIWQVRGDRNTKFADWMRMDMEYIRRRSLLFDLKLIFETIFVALLHRGSV